MNSNISNNKPSKTIHKQTNTHSKNKKLIYPNIKKGNILYFFLRAPTLSIHQYSPLLCFNIHQGTNQEIISRPKQRKHDDRIISTYTIILSTNTLKKAKKWTSMSD